jgi:hypothetical protein
MKKTRFTDEQMVTILREADQRTRGLIRSPLITVVELFRQPNQFRVTPRGRLDSMSVRRATVAAVLTICLGAPVVELFDTWDSPADRGSDSELSMVAVALCAGLALTAAGSFAVKLCRPAVSNSIQTAPTHLCVRNFVFLTAVPVPCSRPPTLLRI